jgi:hypothetical protein
MRVFNLTWKQEWNPKHHVDRHGADMAARHAEWRHNPSWKQSDTDAEYYRRHPIGSRPVLKSPLSSRP